MIPSALLSLLKLIAILLIIPTLFSIWSHLRNNSIPTSNCYVGPLDTMNPSTQSFYGFFGIWINRVPNSDFSLLTKCNLHHPSTHVRPDYNQDEPGWNCEGKRFSTVYNHQQYKAWCFYDHESDGHSLFCLPQKEIALLTHRSFMPSGIYVSRENPAEKLSVKCSSEENTILSQRGKYNNEFLPTTSLLLLLNIGLAFIYWDKRVDPNIVSKHYNKIIVDMELWRSFTGALAHFEPLHLGFNMMSLQALGKALEPHYGSIPFLHYNICLIPLTTIVMMIMIKLQIRYTGNHQFAETSSVGFSGVLFAWMVVSSLESYQVCPIPFASQMCFNTHEFDIGFMALKFNWGPFVQLIFAQFIMPRVSFIGHLAGIICGFVFHWRLFPTSIVWSSQVLIPFLMLLHWRFVRHMKFLSIFYSSENVDDPSVDVGEIESSTKTAEMKTRQKWLMHTLAVMIMITLLTIRQFGLMKNMVLSQILSCSMFAMSIQQHRKRIHHQSSRFSNVNEVLLLWKGVIIALVIALVSDALVVPIWFFTQIQIYSSGWMRLELWKDPLVMAMRWITNFLALIQASTIILELSDSEEEPKVFSLVFGKVLQWSSEVMKTALYHKTNTYTAFGGTGNILGSATPAYNARTRMSVEI